MPDSHEITQNLLAMYGRNDWIMRWNFAMFMRRSGLMALPRDVRILDFGCAMGHLMVMLRNQGFSRVEGLDASPEMVRAAQQQTGLPVLLGDAVECASLFPPATAGAIIISDLVHHVETSEGWEKLLAGCASLLRPDGLLVIREPWPTLTLNLLRAMSAHPILHVGPLRERLISFVEERELLEHFFTHWPPRYQAILARNGFQVERDFSWLVHRITSARLRPVP